MGSGLSMILKNCVTSSNGRFFFAWQMTLRQNQENKDQEAGNSIRLLLEAAKVEPTDAAVKVEDPELEGEESVEELQAEKLDEEDKSSPSTLFKPAAARPKLVLPVRVPEGNSSCLFFKDD